MGGISTPVGYTAQDLTVGMLTSTASSKRRVSDSRAGPLSSGPAFQPNRTSSSCSRTPYSESRPRSLSAEWSARNASSSSTLMPIETQLFSASAARRSSSVYRTGSCQTDPVSCR